MKWNFTRYHFIRTGTLTGAGLTLIPSYLKGGYSNIAENPIRFGGPVPGEFIDPVEWIITIKSLEYSYYML